MKTPYRPAPAARRALRKLGEDIREARLRRNLPMEVVAERASTSRSTLARVEKGDPGVGLGVLAGVLQALGLLDRLGDLADSARDVEGLEINRQTLRQRASPPRKRRGVDDD
ncbi:MAG: helix-turn-helix domain-containing protein [Alcanivorax sp.]|nr:helix-turn-helix domain-containing protein [Alcanivorax sp.]